MQQDNELKTHLKALQDQREPTSPDQLATHCSANQIASVLSNTVFAFLITATS